MHLEEALTEAAPREGDLFHTVIWPADLSPPRHTRQQPTYRRLATLVSSRDATARRWRRSAYACASATGCHHFGALWACRTRHYSSGAESACHSQRRQIRGSGSSALVTALLRVLLPSPEHPLAGGVPTPTPAPPPLLGIVLVPPECAAHTDAAPTRRHASLLFTLSTGSQPCHHSYCEFRRHRRRMCSSMAH